MNIVQIYVKSIEWYIIIFMISIINYVIYVKKCICYCGPCVSNPQK